MKPPGIGPQVKSSLVPFTGATHFGYPFLTHSHVVAPPPFAGSSPGRKEKHMSR